MLERTKRKALRICSLHLSWSPTFKPAPAKRYPGSATLNTTPMLTKKRIKLLSRCDVARSLEHWGHVDGRRNLSTALTNIFTTGTDLKKIIYGFFPEENDNLSSPRF